MLIKEPLIKKFYKKIILSRLMKHNFYTHLSFVINVYIFISLLKFIFHSFRYRVLLVSEVLYFHH